MARGFAGTILGRPTRALALAVVIAGALAATASAGSTPSIKLKAPHSAAAGSKFALTVSGFYNCTKKSEDKGKCANFATLDRFSGFASCKKSASHQTHVIAAGPADKRLREDGKMKPEHFSVKIKTKAPGSPRLYTFCAYMGNYPVGGILKRPVATARVNVTAP